MSSGRLDHEPRGAGLPVRKQPLMHPSALISVDSIVTRPSTHIGSITIKRKGDSMRGSNLHGPSSTKIEKSSDTGSASSGGVAVGISSARSSAVSDIKNRSCASHSNDHDESVSNSHGSKSGKSSSTDSENGTNAGSRSSGGSAGENSSSNHSKNGTDDVASGSTGSNSKASGETADKSWRIQVSQGAHIPRMVVPPVHLKNPTSIILVFLRME